MNNFFCLLTPTLLSLVLMAGCGEKWRDTNEIDGYGTITRNGSQTDVCVYHNQKAVYVYHDDEKHDLFDKAMLPKDEIYDDDWSVIEISFEDYDADGNSDLLVYLFHRNMSESRIVWLWEEGEGLVYQSVYSRFYDSIVIRDPPE